MRYCTPIEDEQLLWNCLHYHMNPECFIANFGERGLSLGEWVEKSVEKKFYKCWRENGDKTIIPGLQNLSNFNENDVKTYKIAFDDLDKENKGYLTIDQFH